MNISIIKHLKRISNGTGMCDVTDVMLHSFSSSSLTKEIKRNTAYIIETLLSQSRPIYSIASNKDIIVLSTKGVNRGRVYLMVFMSGKGASYGKLLFVWKTIKKTTFKEILKERKWTSINIDSVDTNSMSKPPSKTIIYSGRAILVGQTISIGLRHHRTCLSVSFLAHSMFSGNKDYIELLEVPVVVQKGVRGSISISIAFMPIPLDSFVKAYYDYQALQDDDPTVIVMSVYDKSVNLNINLNIGYIDTLPDEVLDEIKPKAVAKILKGDKKK